MKKPMSDRSIDLISSKEADADSYNLFYSKGEAYEKYHRHYIKSHYFPVYCCVLDEVLRTGGKKVLEVGCGAGAFASYLMETNDLHYSGFDFSSIAVWRAAERTGQRARFWIGDARKQETYRVSYDVIVCMEALEHILADCEVIQTWRKGTSCICTVPNFDSHDHVRVFRHEDQIHERYGGLIDISTIRRVSRPLLRGRSLREYLRAVRWSRDDPRKFFALLGYKTFENLAGWFVFSGPRRADTLD
jgi:SAM-dependent methyltransferase